MVSGHDGVVNCMFMFECSHRALSGKFVLSGFSDPLFFAFQLSERGRESVVTE